MTKPFFLTRQTANLMEDFTRELKAGASLFLLYGDAGVGKTRLLQELSQKRLADARIHWIDLAAQSSDDQPLQDSSANVEAVFNAADSGDIIIADHFESALKKTRHQLFLSWSTDGVDKRLNLIIASESKGFNELRQLSQQYQVRVHSFQQMPLNADEIEAFLGFYLFPDHPIGKLSIPADLRKRLVATNGAIGPIIKIAERDGAQIGSSPMTDTESIRKGSRIIVTMLILFALAIGVGWYYLSSRHDTPDAVTAMSSGPEPVPEPVAVVENRSEPNAEPVVEPESAAESETEPDAVVEPEPAIASLTQQELAVEPGSVAATEAGSIEESRPENKPPAESDSEAGLPAEPGPANESEPGTASDSEAVIVEEVEQAETGVAATDVSAGDEQLPATRADKSRFEQDLQSSMEWIRRKDNVIGTVQILLLSFSSFDPVAYYDYLDYLALQQVDVSEIRVFKTLTGGSEVYSVFYGEYDSRQAAMAELDGLPAALKKISPIARSVGGILTEIRRLGDGN